MAEIFFRTAHRWMPVVSRVHFYGSLMNPSWKADPSLVTLLLGMKLVLARPEEADLRTELYTLTKEFQLRMEMAGFLSIYLIQSSILTALYEMGHAIYPGAFTTVSTCARYALALGITGTVQAQGRAWSEQEERNRTWWAIITLDRHLCTPDPSIDSQLPIDDDAWDQGVSNRVPKFCHIVYELKSVGSQILPDNQSQTLFSTPCMKDGRYARLTQAVHLLSQVYRHISSREESVRLDVDSINQLERTLFALEHLSSVEEHENHSPAKLTQEGIEESYRSIRSVAAKTIHIIETFRAGERGTIENIPPLALDWLYRPTVAYIILAHDGLALDCESTIHQLKQALRDIGQRWSAASKSDRRVYFPTPKILTFVRYPYSLLFASFGDTAGGQNNMVEDALFTFLHVHPILHTNVEWYTPRNSIFRGGLSVTAHSFMDANPKTNDLPRLSLAQHWSPDYTGNQYIHIYAIS
nr:hypothetical protein CFP56_52213 [Quercus suber]